MADKKACFVIAPIGEPDSQTRKRSDQVLKHIIRPAVESCGYAAVRADEIDKPGIITSQVIQRVVSDPLVVIDLTERNPNVFYELAIRHAIAKPFVQLIQKGERIPFDVAGTRTVQVDHHDLDSAEASRKEIVDQIKALEKDSSAIETPISVSSDLQVLRQSGKPEERSLADLVAAVSDLRGSLAKMEGKATPSQAVSEIRDVIKELTERMESGEFFRRRRLRRFHPMMFEELMHRGENGDDPIVILVMASTFRDDAPWLYEVATEVYRAVVSGDEPTIRRETMRLHRLSKLMMRGPFMEEFGDKDTHMLMMEFPMMLEHLLQRFQARKSGSPSGRRTKAPEAE